MSVSTYIDRQFLNQLVVALHELGPLQHTHAPVALRHRRLLPLHLLHLSHPTQPETWDARTGTHRLKIGFGSRNPGSKQGIRAYPDHSQEHLPVLDGHVGERGLDEVETREILGEIAGRKAV